LHDRLPVTWYLSQYVAIRLILRTIIENPVKMEHIVLNFDSIGSADATSRRALLLHPSGRARRVRARRTGARHPQIAPVTPRGGTRVETQRAARQPLHAALRRHRGGTRGLSACDRDAGGGERGGGGRGVRPGEARRHDQGELSRRARSVLTRPDP